MDVDRPYYNRFIKHSIEKIREKVMLLHNLAGNGFSCINNTDANMMKRGMRYDDQLKWDAQRAIDAEAYKIILAQITIIIECLYRIKDEKSYTDLSV